MKSWWQKVLCFFGFHPPNPHAQNAELRWYVVTTFNGTKALHERCPKCNMFHPVEDANE